METDQRRINLRINGFNFNGSSSLTLQSMKFTGCSDNLTILDEEQFDIISSISSLVCLTQYHAAVLVFTKINHLVMRDMNISQYYGFAIVAVILSNDNLDSINIISSQGIKKAAQYKSGYSLGSGVVNILRLTHNIHIQTNIS